MQASLQEHKGTAAQPDRQEIGAGGRPKKIETPFHHFDQQKDVHSEILRLDPCPDHLVQGLLRNLAPSAQGDKIFWWKEGWAQSPVARATAKGGKITTWLVLGHTLLQGGWGGFGQPAWTRSASTLHGWCRTEVAKHCTAPQTCLGDGPSRPRREPLVHQLAAQLRGGEVVRHAVQLRRLDPGAVRRVPLGLHLCQKARP